jgi:PPM family protein phosphatase
MKTSYSIHSFGISDIGLSRKKNEDYWSSIPEINLFLLADGMGGHRAGEIAAKKAVEVIEELFLKEKSTTKLETLETKLHQAIIKANQDIFEMSHSEPGFRGMGTTLCSLHIQNNKALVGHVGDSRIYRYRKDTLTQLTNDHSLISDLIKTQHVEEDEPIPSPHRNIITKALGPASFVEPEIESYTIEPGDVFLLCSDGLSDYVSERRMKKVLSRDLSLEMKTRYFVSLAKQRRSQDNITLILVQIS